MGASHSFSTHFYHLQTEHGHFNYIIKRSKRQRLSLQIGYDGIIARASLSEPIENITQFIQKNSAWLAKKQQHFAKKPNPINRWEINQHFQLLGKAILLKHHFCNAPPLFIGDTQHPQHGDILLIDTITYPTCPIEQCVQPWLKEQAMKWLSTRLLWFEQNSGIKCTGLRLSKARQSWGQCNSKGVIGLNWRLIHLPPEQIDYVIAHELAHLTYMNHSPSFWDEVARIMPNYEIHKAAIKEQGGIFL